MRTLLREVASRELGDVPVRLLVLSREGGDRWFDLVESAHAGELMDAQEVRLSGLAAAEPERLFSGALCRLAEHYPRAIPAVPSDAVRSWVGLNPGLHGLPLLLTAAAIHMFLNPDAALGFSGASVIQALTDREWARLANTGRAAGFRIGAAQDALSHWLQCRDPSMLPRCVGWPSRRSRWVCLRQIA